MELVGDTDYEEPRNSLPGSSSSVDATLYSEVESHTRDLPPIPVEFDDLATHNYNDIDDTVEEVISGDKPQSDSDTLLDDSPFSPVETPYSGLESSTFEPSPAPVPYDNLTKHDYANTDISTEVTIGIICDASQSNSEILSNVPPSSAVETSYSRLDSSTRKPSPAPVPYDSLTKHDYANTNVTPTEMTNG